jgi:hemerythrin-like domain-containing protein
MSATLAQWHVEHKNFAKLLDCLEGQLDLFHDGSTPHYDLMLDIMFYMTHYPDVLHHPKEDFALARMRTRDPAVGAIADELDLQHEDLQRMGADLVVRLSDIVNDGIATRESVEIPARDYIATFREHMNFEERRVLPMAAQLLRDADWADIDAALRHIEDPLFGRNPEPRYAAIERHLERQAERR